MKRVALNAKRDKPRRNEGRISHERMKPRAKVAPTAIEKAHMDAVAALGCLCCGRPAEVHHVMKVDGKVRRRDHRFVVPLCELHHRGPRGVHGLGSESAFKAVYQIDLAEWAVEAWERTIRQSAPTPPVRM